MLDDNIPKGQVCRFYIYILFCGQSCNQSNLRERTITEGTVSNRVFSLGDIFTRCAFIPEIVGNRVTNNETGQLLCFISLPNVNRQGPFTGNNRRTDTEIAIEDTNLIHWNKRVSIDLSIHYQDGVRTSGGFNRNVRVVLFNRFKSIPVQGYCNHRFIGIVTSNLQHGFIMHDHGWRERDIHSNDCMTTHNHGEIKRFHGESIRSRTCYLERVKRQLHSTAVGNGQGHHLGCSEVYISISQFRGDDLNVLHGRRTSGQDHFRIRTETEGPIAMSVDVCRFRQVFLLGAGIPHIEDDGIADNITGNFMSGVSLPGDHRQYPFAGDNFRTHAKIAIENPDLITWHQNLTID